MRDAAGVDADRGSPVHRGQATRRRTMTTPPTESSQAWPRLRVDDWADTRDTLHMWTQIVGKIRLSQAPLVNHWWQVTLYVRPRRHTTSERKRTRLQSSPTCTTRIPHTP